MLTAVFQPWQIAAMAAAAILVAVVAGLAKRKRPGTAGSDVDGPWPFALRPNLLGAAEQVLLHRLREALPDKLIFAQVSVSRLLAVTTRASEQSWFNRIAQKSIDFVVCRPDTRPIVAIELDDASHDSARSAARDAVKDRACAAAGLPILRWRVKAMPSVAEIAAAVREATPVTLRAGEEVPV
jgi:very-short-patch-repair endonuclease